MWPPLFQKISPLQRPFCRIQAWKIKKQNKKKPKWNFLKHQRVVCFSVDGKEATKITSTRMKGHTFPPPPRVSSGILIPLYIPGAHLRLATMVLKCLPPHPSAEDQRPQITVDASPTTLEMPTVSDPQPLTPRGSLHLRASSYELRRVFYGKQKWSRHEIIPKWTDRPANGRAL